ncbi:MAG TPA: 2-succinyl-5-enolpyruvyl-6-hydroxy-3-cyclohexene-1-carboxylic-acid synthase [Thermoleophilaceae bacterium]|nr:2-succinyl-5-enolpyruvyl-6-hydroxy-3-cyclohexene-1-carboxylic-acid synthase [Thermoleophilaceae bacterium]
MIPINSTYAPVQAMVDELVRCGLTHAVTCPGSRNAPIVLTLAGDERLTPVSVIDERAAGFMALGMAKASGRPVAVTCTSGTAAANLAPAVHEAWQARVPLIVLTADRPPELRDVGAGQAIDQIGLYGSAAKWFVELGNSDPGPAWNAHVRAIACRAWFTAAGGRPGPVHVNLPLREPLAPVPGDVAEADWQGRAGGAPWTVVREHPQAPDGDDVQRLADRMAAAPRGAVVCGAMAGDVAEAVARLAARSGWPVLADALSGVRCGQHDLSHVVAHYDVLLRDQGFAAGHRPDLVLRVGDTPTSKPLRAWLGDAKQVVCDPFGAWHDPTRSADTVLAADPAAACDALAAALEMRGAGADAGWLASWRAADALVPPALAEAPDPFEPKVYAALAETLPEGAQVWVSSSMPVREVESFFPVTDTPIRFLSNRGANGIDGVVASAAGAALATGAPTWVLIGEVALVHDAGGLLAAGRAGADLRVICVNNGGGGIFDFLPLPGHAEAAVYEEHVATPTGVEPAALAALAGMKHLFSEVRTDRADSVRLHRELYQRVGERLATQG